MQIFSTLVRFISNSGDSEQQIKHRFKSSHKALLTSAAGRKYSLFRLLLNSGKSPTASLLLSDIICELSFLIVTGDSLDGGHSLSEINFSYIVSFRLERKD